MKAINVSLWDCDNVANWLNEQGFGKYAQIIAYEHQIDGSALLLLTENDLRQPPLQLKALGDVKKLGRAFAELRQQAAYARLELNNLMPNGTTVTDDNYSPNSSPQHSSSDDSAEIHDGFIRNRSEPRKSWFDATTTNAHTINASHSSPEFSSHHPDLISRVVESPDTPQKSLLKTSIAFFYCISALLITSFVMVLVHDRVPDMKMYPPLPDIVLDNVPLIPWAFEVCEILAMTMSFIWCLILVFHKYRVILMRRMFSLVGTVFLLRCITMLITSLSVPGVHLECRAKSYGDIWQKLNQAFNIWSGMGMSLQGVRTCGDYMFSGHTTAITLLNHFITEYTPSNWSELHTATWVMNLFGIFFILAGHEHYSIDVFIAFYISSRLFLYYHTLAYHRSYGATADQRIRTWFPLTWFFEGGSIGRVRNEFELPIPSTDTIKNFFQKSNKTQSPNHIYNGHIVRKEKEA